MVSVTITNVTKRFGDVRAVDDVSLSIEKGELFFLLGPSGCGKTTLLRMIAGFYFPDEGHILFDGRDVGRMPPHERNTGMVFQNYALWPHMTVRENLTFGLEMHRIPQADRRARVDRALEMVQMHDLADRSPNQLSGGQQQRVALGRALVLEPDVVLMDEPLSNLDAKLRLEMRAQIKRIHEELGVAIVYVTHDQNEALSMADRMAIMRKGRIAELGRPRDLYHRPGSRFVADFVGETNLLAGIVRSAGDLLTVDTAVGPIRSSTAANGLAPGDRALCSIRPERLDVLAAGSTSPNMLQGTVSRVFFLGNHDQYFVTLADGTEVKAIEFDTKSAKAAPHEAARLGCGPDDVVVLRDEE